MKPPCGGAPQPRASHPYPATFPPALVAYCERSGIHPTVFAEIQEILPSIPRYLRVKPSAWRRLKQSSNKRAPEAPVGAAPESSAEHAWYDDVRATIADSLHLAKEVVHYVPWLPCWSFSVPRTAILSSSSLYKDAIVYAMDAASMAAVVALRPQRTDMVLDLCCCPGMKLALIADSMAESSGLSDASDSGASVGCVVGVDVSLDRLFVARAVLTKYGVRNAMLVHGDGRGFSLSAAIAQLDSASVATKVGPKGLTAREQRRVAEMKSRSNPTEPAHGDAAGKPELRSFVSSAAKRGALLPVYAPLHARQQLERLQNNRRGELLFDRVLVDVECSHDGSLAHLAFEDPSPEVPEPSRLPFPLQVEHVEARSPKRPISNVHRMQRMNLPHDFAESGADPVEVCPPAASLPVVLPSPAVPQNRCDDSLNALQLELLLHGFSQLRPGGVLVYSTCSFSRSQNEGVVRRLCEAVNAPPLGRQGPSQYDGYAVIVHPFHLECLESSSEEHAPGSECRHTSSATPRVAQDSVDEAVNITHLTTSQQRELRPLLYALPSPDALTTPSDLVPQDWCCTRCNPERQWGVRFWPKHTMTSFQFICKVWKSQRKAGPANGE